MSVLETVTFLARIARVSLCGSQLTGGATPESDIDYLVICNNASAKRVVVQRLKRDNFTPEGDKHYDVQIFQSWRRDLINFIVTDNQEFANRHLAATALCKRLKLLNKADRIAVFQAVLYGNVYDK